MIYKIYRIIFLLLITQLINSQSSKENNVYNEIQICESHINTEDYCDTDDIIEYHLNKRCILNNEILILENNLAICKYSLEQINMYKKNGIWEVNDDLDDSNPDDNDSNHDDGICNVLTGKNCSSEKYYLVDKEDEYAIINEINTNGNLYYCEEESKPCTEKEDVGYYVIDEDTVYTCKKSNNLIKCILGSIDRNIKCASNEDIGKLIINSQSNISICLNYVENTSYITELNNENSGNYIISKNPSNDIFIVETGYSFAIISINNNVITLKTDYNNKFKYTYVDVSLNNASTYKILLKGDTCPDSNSNILELECNNTNCKSN